VLTYVRRRVGDDTAQDLVAETYAIAWRRWRAIPADPFPYLIGIARNLIASDARSRYRDRDLVARLLLNVTESVAQHVDPERRLDAIAVLAGLSEQDREALLLVGWDGLSDDEAASVLGLRPATFRKRLSRARSNLTAATRPLTARISQENK